jgi:hypothetical protein
MSAHQLEAVAASLSSCVPPAQEGLVDNRQPVSHPGESQYVFNFGACMHWGFLRENFRAKEREPGSEPRSSIALLSFKHLGSALPRFSSL